jgi:hypothetical protein
MTISFDKLLTHCLLALGDSTCATWSRTDAIWSWCIEAMLAFPILRPAQQVITVAGAASYQHDLASDFREIVSVEYPVSQDPPEFLSRLNRLDPNFYSSDDSYDMDRNYVDGTGWVLFTSKKLAVGQVIKINYLANHDTDLEDDPASYITVPDEYESILVAYVVAKGYRERLGNYMQDPTAHMTIITQMTTMVLRAEENYNELVKQAVARYTESRILPHRQVDKFDRTY